MVRGRLAGFLGFFLLFMVGWSMSGAGSGIYVSDYSAGILYYPTLDSATPQIRDVTSTGLAHDVCGLSDGGFATLSSIQRSIYVFDSWQDLSPAIIPLPTDVYPYSIGQVGTSGFAIADNDRMYYYPHGATVPAITDTIGLMSPYSGDLSSNSSNDILGIYGDYGNPTLLQWKAPGYIDVVTGSLGGVGFQGVENKIAGLSDGRTALLGQQGSPGVWIFGSISDPSPEQINPQSIFDGFWSNDIVGTDDGRLAVLGSVYREQTTQYYVLVYNLTDTATAEKIIPMPAGTYPSRLGACTFLNQGTPTNTPTNTPTVFVPTSTPTDTPTETPTPGPVQPGQFYVLTDNSVLAFDDIKDQSPDTLDLSPYQKMDSIFKDLSGYENGFFGLADGSTGKGFAFEDIFDTTPYSFYLPGLYNNLHLDGTDDDRMIFLDSEKQKISVESLDGQPSGEQYLVMEFGEEPGDVAWLEPETFAVITHPTSEILQDRIDIYQFSPGIIGTITGTFSPPKQQISIGGLAGYQRRIDAMQDGTILVLDPNALSVIAYPPPYLSNPVVLSVSHTIQHAFDLTVLPDGSIAVLGVAYSPVQAAQNFVLVFKDLFDTTPNILEITPWTRTAFRIGAHTFGRTEEPTPTFTPTVTPTAFPTDCGWEFNTEGDLEGWTYSPMLQDVTVTSGNLYGVSTGNDPKFFSPVVSCEAANYQYVEIRMKVTTGATGVVFYKTASDPNFTSTKKVMFNISDNDSFVVYGLHTSGFPSWSGIINQFRFDPTEQSGGEVFIDYIRLLRIAPTVTPSNTPTETPTYTSTPSDTPTNTVVPTNTPTNTLTSTSTPSDTPTNTVVATKTPTDTPTETETPCEVIEFTHCDDQVIVFPKPNTSQDFDICVQLFNNTPYPWDQAHIVLGVDMGCEAEWAINLVSCSVPANPFPDGRNLTVEFSKRLSPGEDVSIVFNSQFVGTLAECKQVLGYRVIPGCVIPTSTPTDSPTNTPTRTFTPTRTPTPTRTRTPTPTNTPVPLDLFVHSYEIVQVVQNAAKSVPLVAGKPTVFRAYISLDAPVVNQEGDIWGKLYYIRNGHTYGPVYQMNNSNTEIEAVQTPKREEYTHSLNFRLPKHATEAGVTNFWVELNPLRYGKGAKPTRRIRENDYSNNRFPSIGWVAATFNARADYFRIGYYKVTYNPPTKASASPTNGIHQGDDMFKRIFPIDPDVIDYRYLGDFTYTRDLQVQANITHFMSQMNMYWVLSEILRALVGFEQYDQMHAWLPSQAVTYNGCSDPTWIGSLGRSAFSCETAGPLLYSSRWRRTFAHEIGHNFGRYHPGDDPSGQYRLIENQEYGFDVANDVVRYKYYDPDTDSNVMYRDIMWPARKEFEAWITPYTYRGFYNWSFIEPDAARARKLFLHENPTEAILVSGAVTVDGTGEVFPCYRVTAGVSPTSPTGEYSLELVDSANKTLLKHQFSPEFYSHDVGRDGEVEPGEGFGTFFEVLSFEPGTAAILLKKNEDLLDRLPVSASTPSVKVLAPNGGEVLSGTFEIQWEGSDPDPEDAGRLDYTVLFSSDNKESWIPIGTLSNETSLLTNTATLPGGTECFFRVMVTDGVNTSTDDSDAGTTVEGKPPFAVIYSPSEGAHFSGYEVIQLRGRGQDVDDGILGEKAHVWTSDKDGTIGTGSLVETVSLSPGDHLITLAVTDSDGNEVSESVTITIDDTLVVLGDVHRDGVVDSFDMLQVANYWQKSASDEGWNSSADIDEDGLVTEQDLLILMLNLEENLSEENPTPALLRH